MTVFLKFPHLFSDVIYYICEYSCAYSFLFVPQLCGKQSIHFWEDDIEDFGECFTSLALVAPAHAFLAIASAYYIGKNPATYYIRTKAQKVALYIRTIVVSLINGLINKTDKFVYLNEMAARQTSNRRVL